MNFLKTSLLATLAVAMLIPAAQVQAGKWYDNKYVWGGTGLVAGGVLGYAIGRDSSRPHYAPSYGPSYGGGDGYFKETRVWPFYRRTEYIPVMNTGPVTFTPQAVSYGDVMLRSLAAANAQSPEPQEVNVTVGNNNENVTIVVGGSDKTVNAAKATVITKNNIEGTRVRVVDVKVDDKDAKETDVKEGTDATITEEPTESTPEKTETPAAPTKI